MRWTNPPRGIPPTGETAVRRDGRMPLSCGTGPAVYSLLGISVFQLRNKRRRAAYFDPGGVSFRDKFIFDLIGSRHALATRKMAQQEA